MMMQEKNWNDLASSYKELFSELSEVDEALSIIHKMTDSYTKIEVSTYLSEPYRKGFHTSMSLA